MFNTWYHFLCLHKYLILCSCVVQSKPSCRSQQEAASLFSLRTVCASSSGDGHALKYTPCCNTTYCIDNCCVWWQMDFSCEHWQDCVCSCHMCICVCRFPIKDQCFPASLIWLKYPIRNKEPAFNNIMNYSLSQSITSIINKDRSKEVDDVMEAGSNFSSALVS